MVEKTTMRIEELKTGLINVRFETKQDAYAFMNKAKKGLPHRLRKYKINTKTPQESWKHCGFDTKQNPQYCITLQPK